MDEHKYTLEETQVMAQNAYHNRDHEVAYLQQRLDDANDLICDLVELMSSTVSTLRTELELLRADVAKGDGVGELP